jgi:phage baseplate assembly protein W
LAQPTIRGYSSVGRDTGGRTLINFELAKQDLMNTLYTNKGERLMMPEYGNDAIATQFQPMTANTADYLRKTITEIIDGDPRLTLKFIDTQLNQNTITVYLTVFYVPAEAEDTLILNFDTSSYT